MSHPSCPAIRHLLLTNLRLLGLSPSSSLLSGPYQGAALDPESFLQGAVNVKTFELATHYLFTLLDPELAKKTFAGIFPCRDRRQSREYMVLAFHWLEHLKREGSLPKDLVLRKSYLEDCRGERFERIMLALTEHAMQAQMEQIYNTPFNPSPDIDILGAQLKKEKEAFLQTCADQASVEDEIHLQVSRMESWVLDLSDKIQSYEKAQREKRRRIDQEEVDSSKPPKGKHLDTPSMVNEVQSQWDRCESWIHRYQETSHRAHALISSIQSCKASAPKIHLDHGALPDLRALEETHLELKDQLKALLATKQSLQDQIKDLSPENSTINHDPTLLRLLDPLSHQGVGHEPVDLSDNMGSTASCSPIFIRKPIQLQDDLLRMIQDPPLADHANEGKGATLTPQVSTRISEGLYRPMDRLSPQTHARDTKSTSSWEDGLADIIGSSSRLGSEREKGLVSRSTNNVVSTEDVPACPTDPSSVQLVDDSIILHSEDMDQVEDLQVVQMPNQS
ncbi:MAG: HAUS augmin-like complex subunit 6 N-terminus-domain-containing protein [Piptocephalis tieghemiana]|nr:MAG: HAUS augmin-like complex subunit 6 N-terminus-domain-containing protein [Piptocephalis tieghemiana]